MRLLHFCFSKFPYNVVLPELGRERLPFERSLMLSAPTLEHRPPLFGFNTVDGLVLRQFSTHPEDHADGPVCVPVNYARHVMLSPHGATGIPCLPSVIHVSRVYDRSRFIR